MYDPQHLGEQNSALGNAGGDSWLSASAGDCHSTPDHRQISSQLSSAAAHHNGGANGNVDRRLFNDLVEMLPLVQTLVARNANRSFTRRGSMTYTKTPSREYLSRKMGDSKGRSNGQPIPGRKKKDQGDKDQGKAARENQDPDSLSMFSTKALATEKEMEELVALREQFDDLQRKLLEKDELLKSTEASKSQLNTVLAKLEDLKLQATQKDSVIKSTELQLSDAKIKLADKTAALEKTQWEAMTAKRKAEQLQGELDSTQANISSVVSLLDGLMKNKPNAHAENYDVKPIYVNHIASFDDLDQIKINQMDEAREAYLAAVAAARERPDEASIAAAACARKHLQSFVLLSSSNTR